MQFPDPRPILRAASTLTALFLVLGFTMAATQAAAQSRPPVILDRSLLTPPKIAETGEAPEVHVRATIDLRGNVSKVEVLSVTPSTEFDPVVVEATKKLIGSWHYAPARNEAGDPEETTLEWTLSYSDSAQQGSTQSSSLLPGLAKSTGHFDLRHLSKTQQGERLERYSTTAERYLDKRNRSTISSPRFIVVTDAEGEGVASSIAGNLEATFNFLDGLFGHKLELMPDGHKIVVYFFAKRSSYLSVSASLGMSGASRGFYHHPGFFAFYQEMPSSDALIHTLLHEATHGYLFRYLLEPAVNPNTWFTEGLAEYVGNSTVSRKGEIEIGKSLSGRYVLDYHRGGAYRRTTGTGWTLDKTKRAIRRNEAPTLSQLIRTPPALFTGERGPLNYAMSWLFVHFLRHGDLDSRGSKGKDGEWAQERFPQFLLYVIEGYPTRDAIEQVYGMPIEQIGELFKDYVKRF